MARAVSTPVPSESGLRERKKERTRQTIVEVALKLFAERGYAETTLAEIADAAEISQSTFFNYFPSKDAVVFALSDQVIDSARERVAGRAEDESTTEAIISWITHDLGEIERPYTNVMRLIPGIITSDDDLLEGARLRSVRMEDAFAEGFAREFEDPPDGMRPRVMAVIAFRGLIDVWDVWFKRHAADPDFDLGALLALKAEYVSQALQAGLTVVNVLPEHRPA
jgi:AcrR family transcriptional regulator